MPHLIWNIGVVGVWGGENLWNAILEALGFGQGSPLPKHFKAKGKLSFRMSHEKL